MSLRHALGTTCAKGSRVRAALVPVLPILAVRCFGCHGVYRALRHVGVRGALQASRNALQDPRNGWQMVCGMTSQWLWGCLPAIGGSWLRLFRFARSLVSEPRRLIAPKGGGGNAHAKRLTVLQRLFRSCHTARKNCKPLCDLPSQR